MSIINDSTIIGSVRGSPAQKANILRGDSLNRINGHVINDRLDYEYYSYDGTLLIEISRRGRRLFVKIRKREGQPLGLLFENDLLDKERSCSNKCIFCFIDQLPRGMRKTLYYKDDDARLSFLQGNYITLTNLTDEEIDRIIRMKICPLNVSVHSMNPELRAMMLGNPKGASGVDVIRMLASAGIFMNCQIVVCPGINDSEELEYTMQELSALYPSVKSVSVVPVGLTKYRDGLFPLKPFEKKDAKHVLQSVLKFGSACKKKLGSRLFYPADEFYILTERPFPGYAFYEDFPQLENGVGMAALLIKEFSDELKRRPENNWKPFAIVTGEAAAVIMYYLLLMLRATPEFSTVRGKVIAVENRFFGKHVSVAGLVTGSDIISALNSAGLTRNSVRKKRILIPRNMLKHGETIFLDDISISDIAEMFSIKIRIVEQNGADLLRAILGN